MTGRKRHMRGLAFSLFAKGRTPRPALRRFSLRAQKLHNTSDAEARAALLAFDKWSLPRIFKICFVTSRARQSRGGIGPHASFIRPRGGSDLEVILEVLLEVLTASHPCSTLRWTSKKRIFRKRAFSQLAFRDISVTSRERERDAPKNPGL